MKMVIPKQDKEKRLLLLLHHNNAQLPGKEDKKS
jgi:hypothetical protein